MQTTTMAAHSVSADYLSAILNWVCPIAADMGGRSKEFMPGQCGPAGWESASFLWRIAALSDPRTQQLTHRSIPSDRLLAAAPAAGRRRHHQQQ